MVLAPRLSRRSGSALLLALLALSSLACESEEDRVRSLVERLSQELPQKRDEDTVARTARIRAQLAPVLSDDVEVLVPGLDAPGDGGFLLRAVIGVVDVFPITDIDVDDAVITLSGSGRRAAVRGEARVSGSQPGDLHGFAVPFELDLKKQGNGWRIFRAVVKEPRRDLPEARP